MTIGMNGVADVGAVVVLERTAREQIPRIFPVSARRVSELFRLEASDCVSATNAKPP